jgi:hypothetical protein
MEQRDALSEEILVPLAYAPNKEQPRRRFWLWVICFAVVHFLGFLVCEATDVVGFFVFPLIVPFWYWKWFVRLGDGYVIVFANNLLCSFGLAFCVFWLMGWPIRQRGKCD